MKSKGHETPIVHCDHQRVRDFLNSDRYHLDDEALIAHLDVCPACRKFMEDQAGEAEKWGETKNLLQTSEFDRAGSSEYSAATCCGSDGNQPVAVKDVLELLLPSEYPNHLGRLGPYEVTGVVGIGGMGVVLKAIDPALDRVIALKVLNPRIANNENARKRFAREAKAAAAVLHPNVIPIHSVSSGAALPYLVMSYIRGGSLQKRLDQEGTLPLVEVLRIGSQIAAGLAAAHEQGLIHRDIKPENILLEEGVERVTITDFGLARSVDDNTITQMGSIAGTPQYMSPEQARGEPLDQQSDLFSLGSLLYAICTGRPPYRDDTSYGVMRKIIDEAPLSIRKLNPEIPAWMAVVIEKLMAKKKEDRFASAKEVHALLDACLSHVQQPLSNPIPGMLVNQQISEKRKVPMKTILFASISLIAMVIGVAQFVFNRTNERTISEQVHLPLGELGGFIDSLMSSQHKDRSLTLGSIGKDDNFMVVTTIDGGVQIRFPAYDTNDIFNKRQAKYVTRLKELASSLSLGFSEESELGNDGTVKGINYIFTVKGDAKMVTATIGQLIEKTFQVDDSASCMYRYYNMPGSYTRPAGTEPRELSSEEFIAALEAGEHVYMGEHYSKIYLIPKSRASDRPVAMNAEILVTDVKQLSPEQLSHIRTSK